MDFFFKFLMIAFFIKILDTLLKKILDTFRNNMDCRIYRLSVFQMFIEVTSRKQGKYILSEFMANATSRIKRYNVMTL